MFGRTMTLYCDWKNDYQPKVVFAVTMLYSTTDTLSTYNDIKLKYKQMLFITIAGQSPAL